MHSYKCCTMVWLLGILGGTWVSARAEVDRTAESACTGCLESQRGNLFSVPWGTIFDAAVFVKTAAGHRERPPAKFAFCR